MLVSPYPRLSPAIHLPFPIKNPETKKLENRIREVSDLLIEKKLHIANLKKSFQGGGTLLPSEEFSLDEAKKSLDASIAEMKELSEAKEDLLFEMDPDLFNKMREKAL